MWGNPTDKADQVLQLVPSQPIRGLPTSVTIKPGDGPRLIQNLVARTEGDLDLRMTHQGAELARANPMRAVTSASLRRYCGDLHGQTRDTTRMGSAGAYFPHAPDPPRPRQSSPQSNNIPASA